MKIMTAMYMLKKGGAYDRFIMMLEAFIERGCHVHCLSLTPIPIDHPLYSNHVVPFPFRIQNGFVAKTMVLLLFPVCLLVVGWREKIDLIVAFGPLYAFLQALPKWVLKKPMVTLIRSDLSSGVKGRIRFEGRRVLSKIFDFVGIRSSDRLIANNLATQKQIVGLVTSRKKEEVKLLFNNISSIPPVSEDAAVHVRVRYGIPEGGKLVVTAGVMTRGKNFEVLIRSLSRLGMKNLFLGIIGDGSSKADSLYRDYLTKMAGDLDLRENVFFTGWLEKEELWKVYNASDLFILPSLAEGMPNALLEALGADLPCIGSDIPGIRDILHFRELMFDPADEESLSRILYHFFSQIEIPTRIRQLCQQRKQVFLFNWKEKVFAMVSGVLFPAEGEGRGKGLQN
jgi:glycosyltransferase involved in cell wall biosynthesis